MKSFQHISIALLLSSIVAIQPVLADPPPSKGNPNKGNQGNQGNQGNNGNSGNKGDNNLGWVTKTSQKKSNYQLTDFGVVSLNALGVETSLPQASRRALVCACLDWSERRFHLGGTIGAALLTFFLNNKWVTKDLNSRSLSVTKRGYAGLESYFGISSNQSSRS